MVKCDLCSFPLTKTFVRLERIVLKERSRSMRVCQCCADAIANVQEAREKECNHSWHIVPGGKLSYVKEQCAKCHITRERPYL